MSPGYSLSTDACQNLLHSQGHSETASYLSNILYKIDTIKCAREWNSQRGPGSLKQKHAHNVALYQCEFPSHFRGLGLAEKSDKMKQLKSEYGKWMQSREGQITARNQLLKAWENVGAVSLCVLDSCSIELTVRHRCPYPPFFRS